MKLIYIEATRDEIESNKTLAEALTDALAGFAHSIVKFEPVIKATYEFSESEESEE